jgi:glycosyltransferase involved in cell wall biosynthesis
MTKVLLIEPNIEYPGNTGGSVHMMELSDKLGEEVDLMVACDCGEDFKEDGVEFYDLDCGGFSLRSLGKIRELAKDADVIHTRSDPFELAGPITAKLQGKPLVSEVNVNFLAYEKKHTRRDLFYPVFQTIKYLWLKLITQRSDKVITVSKSIREQLLKIGFEEKKVGVVHNGGNPERFEGLDKEEMREELDLPEGYLVLLMGELGPRHGLDRIIDIDSEEVNFLIMGGIDKYRKHLEEMKEEAPENFIFHDPVPYEEIRKYIVASDVTVAPYNESDNGNEFGFCPIKILDSMAAGRPVVASDRPWIREVMSEDEGVITDDMEEGIRELMDEEKRREKGENALERVKEGLSWKHTAEKVAKIYRELV